MLIENPVGLYHIAHMNGQRDDVRKLLGSLIENTASQSHSTHSQRIVELLDSNETLAASNSRLRMELAKTRRENNALNADNLELRRRLAFSPFRQDHARELPLQADQRCAKNCTEMIDKAMALLVEAKSEVNSCFHNENLANLSEGNRSRCRNVSLKRPFASSLSAVPESPAETMSDSSVVSTVETPRLPPPASTPFVSINQGQGEVEGTGRQKRAATKKITSFREPSLIGKVRRPANFDRQKDFLLSVSGPESAS